MILPTRATLVQLTPGRSLRALCALVLPGLDPDEPIVLPASGFPSTERGEERWGNDWPSPCGPDWPEPTVRQSPLCWLADRVRELGRAGRLPLAEAVHLHPPGGMCVLFCLALLSGCPGRIGWVQRAPDAVWAHEAGDALGGKVLE